MNPVVVDVGCATHDVESISYLIDRFHPTVLYGFDPWPEMEEGDYASGATRVVLGREAAWTCDGRIDYTPAGTGSHVGEGPLSTRCFDLARWLDGLNADQLVVKIDAEGAEYPLLEHLIATGVDAQIKLLLVEWHDGDHGLPDKLACPVEEWER